MGHKKNQLQASDARHLRGDATSAHPACDGPARPRLGAPDDAWSTVMKDVVREAPKTALVIAGTVLLTLLCLIGNLIGVFAGYGAAAPPSHSPVAHVLQVAIEAAWRATSSAG